MPASTATSSFVSEMAGVLQTAHEQHKKDETNYGGGGDLPAGIEGGVAQLVDCKFAKYKDGDNAGKWFFYAAGVVKAPTVHDNIRIEGLRTSIMEPLCETPTRTRKTVAEHWAWILNEFRKLGVDTKSLPFSQAEAVAAALKKSKPHFRFRTWKGEPTQQYPDPRVNEQWKGLATEGAAAGASKAHEDVVDESAGKAPGTAPANRMAAGPSSPATQAPAASPAVSAPSETPTSPNGAKPYGGVGDELDMLGDRAGNGDLQAQAQLAARAKAVGVDELQVNDAENWESVVDMIRQASPNGQSQGPAAQGPDIMGLAQKADDGDQDAADRLSEISEQRGLDPNDFDTWALLGQALSAGPAQTYIPKKDDVTYYQPPKAERPVEVTVLSVNEEKRTVNVKDLDTGKSYKSVAWDQLVDAPAPAVK